MPENSDFVPLFPLNTVLFPNGILPLKVFEARYIDMVSDCMMQQRPFGVVLIKSGAEVGRAAQPEAVGCLAEIIQWDMHDLGLLTLRTQGGQRFRILQQRVLADQRLEAQIEMIASDVPAKPDAIHVSCAATLKMLIADVDQKGRSEYGDEYTSPFSSPLQLDNAGWVANRWCEILPLPLKARQRLMEMTDGQARLALIHQYLQQHQII
jgi:uncharacterized protein